MQSPPQKDYAAAFGALQSQYGMGGLPAPLIPQKDTSTRKWYKWGSRSSSTASLIRSTTPSDAILPSSHVMPSQGTLTESELRFGTLMAEYGYGPVSQAHLNHK